MKENTVDLIELVLKDYKVMPSGEFGRQREVA